MVSGTKVLLASTALAMTLSTTAMADEFELNRMFVIGDSLSDGGTYTQSSTVVLAGQGLRPPTATNNDFRFRFTNNALDGSSRTYAEVLADSFGIPLQPNLITGVPAAAGTPLAALVDNDPVGGTNYAQGGARVRDAAANQEIPVDGPGTPTPTQLGITQTPALTQIQSMIADLGPDPSLGSTDLVVIWAGANDVLTLEGGIDNGALTDAQADGAAAQTAGLLVEGIEDILALGPANVIVVTTPDIGRNTPYGNVSTDQGGVRDPADLTNSDRADDLTRLVGIYNTALKSGVGGRVALVDSDAVLSAVLDSPARYGFSDIGNTQRAAFSCTTSAVQCVQGVNTNPATANLDLVFADPVHPSEEAHNVLAQIAGAALVGIGQVGAMPVATISALRQQSVGLEQRLNLGAFFVNDETGTRVRRPVGNVEVYGGVEAGFYESDTQQVVPGFDAQTQVVKVAVDTMITPNVMVGIGASLDHGQVDFEDDQGGFDSRLLVGGVFGVAQVMRGVYVNAFLGGGLIESIDVERNYGIDDISGARVATERYEADTDGTYFIARTNIGAVLPVGNGFFVNPSAGFAYERVDIDGYTERAQGGSMAAAQATVGDLEYIGYRGTLALGGFYRPPSAPTWTFGLRASWEHDFNDDDIEVPFALGTVQQNVQKAPRPDDSYGLISATIVKELSHSTSASLQGTTNIGQDGVSGYNLGLVFKHTF